MQILVISSDNKTNTDIRTILSKKYELIDVITRSEIAFNSVEKYEYNIVICDLDDSENVERFNNLRKFFPWKSKKFVFLSKGITNQKTRVLLSEFPGKWALKPINEFKLNSIINKISSSDKLANC